MINTRNRVKSSTTRRTKRDVVAQQQQDKLNSPGVPPNTCPHVDLVLTMISELVDAYDRSRERGEAQPKVDDMKQMCESQLEYIRRANECLRDNSLYWYNKYKQLL